MSWLLAALACAAGVGAETLLAGSDVSAQLKSIKQPSWALPLAAWIGIGLAYYAACFFVLQMLFEGSWTEGLRSIAILLLLVVMGANAAFNWVFFKRRWFGAAFWYFLPYTALITALIIVLAYVEVSGAVIFALYALYLPYALFWSFRVWRMNA